MNPDEKSPMKRRRFFVTLAAAAAGFVSLRHFRIFPRTIPPPGQKKVTVTLNPLAVPRDKNRRRNG